MKLISTYRYMILNLKYKYTLDTKVYLYFYMLLNFNIDYNLIIFLKIDKLLFRIDYLLQFIDNRPLFFIYNLLFNNELEYNCKAFDFILMIHYIKLNDYYKFDKKTQKLLDLFHDITILKIKIFLFLKWDFEFAINKNLDTSLFIMLKSTILKNIFDTITLNKVVSFNEFNISNVEINSF